MSLPQHPEVEKDLAGLSSTDPVVSMRLVRLNAFVEHVEKLSRKSNYQELWPDRLPGEIGQFSIAGSKLGTNGPVTFYTWEREGFVLSLEERLVNGRPEFRWLACVPDGKADEVIAKAQLRAETHWNTSVR